MHKGGLARQYIEQRLTTVAQLLHEVSHNVFARRKQSALPLPFGNFQSNLIGQLRDYWYNQLDVVSLKNPSIPYLSDFANFTLARIAVIKMIDRFCLHRPKPCTASRIRLAQPHLVSSTVAFGLGRLCSQASIMT